jgi:ribonucleotide reductase alpha subunit
MNTYLWKDAENENHYYYNENTGRIIGQVHKVSHTKVWLTKIYTNVHNEELYLGTYISCETAKIAIENHVSIQERTLINES